MIKLCSPDHNSTAVLVGDKLYAGTAADYQVPHHHHHHHGRAGRGRDLGCDLDVRGNDHSQISIKFSLVKYSSVN